MKTALMFKQYENSEKPYLTLPMVRQKVLWAGLKRKGNKIAVPPSKDREREVETYDFVQAFPEFVVMRHALHGYTEAFRYMDLYQRLVG